jgi:amino acid adenylation domain-containing protein/non-ribosomal peptide synthase protein (TIGR01720 family)
MSDGLSRQEELFDQLLLEEGLELRAAPVISRRAERGEAPLSFAQSRLWFLDHLDDPTPNYNMPGVLRLEGELDVEALRLGLRDIRNRHDSLRTRFVRRDSDPVQVIDPPADFALPIVDLTGFPAEERERRFRALASQHALDPFDLAQGPLIRVQLIRLEPQRHQLLIAMHHIVSDGWSVGILIQELTILYQARLSGAAPALPDLDIQYSDYAAWQHAHLTRAALEPSLAYWRERLTGAPEVLELPTDRARPPVQSYAGGKRRFSIGPVVVTRLRQLGRQHQATLFMVLQAAFAALLSRYSGSDDIVFGTPVANRAVPGVEPLIGFFVNTLVLRTDLAGDPSFDELIERVRRASLADLDHQHLPFGYLVDELQPQRNLSYTPLIQALFVLQNTPQHDLRLAGLTVSLEEPETDIAKFDLTMVLTETGAGLDGEIEYNASLFDPATIDRMAGHFENLLGAMARAPDARVSEAAVLSAAERDLLLNIWNDTASDFPRDLCVQALFERQAAATPDAVALVFRDRQLTYAELNARSNQVAHRLRALGVDRDVAVPIICERSLELIVGILGIVKSGGAYVPLDPKYPAERLSYMFGQVESPVILTHRACAETLPADARNSTILLLDDDWALFARESTADLEHHAQPKDLIYVIFTSGSTGRPKGVRVVHDGITRLVRNIDYCHLGADETILQLTPISFDVSAFEIWGALLNGGTLVMPEPHILSFQEIGQTIRDFGITTAWLTAGLFHLMVDEYLEGLRPLRQLLAGGDALSIPHCRRVLREIPTLRLINGYGPTECTVFTACCTLTEALIAGTMPIGRPVPNTKLYILDRFGNLVPPGCPGELHAGGYGLARDYLNDPDLTAAKFIPDPFDDRPGARLYRIGDLCRYRPDGNIEYLGRVDRQVKIRGFRIELGEIEAVLSSQQGVRDCTVVARLGPDGIRRLVAYVIPADPDHLPDEDGLRASLSEKLPEFMVPAGFAFLDRFPLNPSGKIDRDALPDPPLVSSDEEFVAPRTAAEVALAEIWTELLDVERIGIHENFFGAGGHSLMAIQLVSRIRDRFGIELPVRRIFEAPTIGALAAGIDGLQQAEDRPRRLPPIARRPPDQPPSLSFAQQRLWFLSRMDPANAAYNVPIALRLTGKLRTDLVARCFDEILRRHEALRTNFVERDGVPEPVLQAPRPAVLDVRDLRAERDEAWSDLLQGEALKPFDLATEPLLRLTLLRLADDDHVLTVTMHHIVTDGWSLGVLFGEFARLYQAFAAGQASPLDDLAIQYSDYAAWQRAWLQDDLLAEQLAYWRDRLAGAPALLELPTQAPRPVIQTYPGRTHLFEIDARTLAGLRQLGGESDSSLFMVLLAVYAALLARYSGQNDIVIGSPIANRKHSDTEALIGFFINTLALRIDVAGVPSFRDLLARVRDGVLGAFAHDDLPFEQLVEHLAPGRALGHSPIFQTLFVLQNTPLPRLELPELTLAAIDLPSRVAKFDLTLTLEEVDGVLRGEVEYNTDLFEADAIARLADHYSRLLRAAVASPDEPVACLPMLSGADRQRLLSDWAYGPAEAEVTASVSRWFEQQAAQSGDAIALIDGDGCWTYRDLNARANQLAHHLRSLGVGTDHPVGICLERGCDMVVAQLAVLKAGGAYVPLDPAYPDERLGFMIRDSGMRLLLTASDWLARHPQDAVAALCLDADWPSVAGESDADLGTAPGADDLAYIIYTSGSTGRPKGVAIPHRALANHMAWMAQSFAMTPEDRVLQKTPFSFDASVWEFYLPLLTGGTLVLAKPGGHSDTEYLVETIRTQRVTVFQGVPSLLRMLAETRGYRDLDSLRLVFSGGEVLTGDLRDRLLALPQVTLCNLYGPTEACIDATFHVCRRGDAERTVPIGRPIRNAAIYVLDPHRQPVPIGVPGQLFIGGTPLARGYWQRPDLTAEKFGRNPFGDGRLYATGDRVRFRADGALEFLGRIDDQIKLRGFRIELGEVESALRADPSVGDAAAIVTEDQRLAAFVTAAEARTVSIPDLRTSLKDRLPDYMVPTAWAVLDRLPRLPNGKIDRAALPVAELAQTTGRVGAAPASGTEELLASLWAGLLDAEAIGRDDNFFELGGHSLLATRLISRLRDAFSLELPLRTIFEAPTLAGLARLVDEAMRDRKNLTPPPGILAAPRPAKLPLSFAQQRLWFLQRMDAANPFYNMPMALEIRGALDVAVLRRCLEALVRRHEALRTSFVESAAEPAQLVHADWDMPLALVDLSDLSGAALSAEIRRQIEQEAAQVFDLSKDLLLRAGLLRVAEDCHVLMLTLHHIVSDGWSMGIVVDEMVRLYTAFAKDQPSPLLPLPIQYADFALWQREHLASRVQGVQLSYWRERLAGAPPMLDLPTDHRRPAVHSFRGGQVPVRFDPVLSQQLRAFSRANGATLFMSLVAGFAGLLARYTRQDDILVGTPIANRGRAEIEGLIGFFVNLLVLRSDVSGDPSFRELLHQTRRSTLDAYAHQDLPFEQLVEALHIERDTSRNPIVQVSFALQNAPMPPLEVEGLRLQSIELDATTVRFDLEAHLWDTEAGIEGYFLYYRDIFEPDTIVRLVKHYENLLRAAIADPALPVSALPLLDAEERRALIGAPMAAAPATRCLHHWFEAQAARTPDAVAVTVPRTQETAGEALTYAALNTRANRLAHCLRQRGAGPEMLVGLCVDRSLDMIVGVLGILKAGAAYVPLDPDYPRDRLAFMLADSGVPILVTQSHHRAALPETSCEVIQLDRDEAVIAAFPPDNPDPVAGPDNIAYVIYTSGSTGRPKGVLVTHANVSRLLTSTEPLFGFGAGDVWTLFHSYAFDFSVWEIWGALLYGGRLVVLPYWISRTPNAFRDLLSAEGVTILNQTPSAFRQLAEADAAGGQPPLSLRAIIFGGEALDPRSLRPWFDRHGDERPQLINMFGITETTVHVTYRRLTRADADQEYSVIGQPIGDLSLRLLDRHLAPVPRGVAGEIFVGGAGVTRGYLNRPELTAERFIADPFDAAPEARLYRTGDLARRLANGDIEYLGRIDDQVKLRGFRIELGEIEAAIRAHPAIQNAIVVVREDAPGDKRLVAYLKPEPAAAPRRSSAETGEAYQRELAAQWQQVFDQNYGETAAEPDLAFNITGWNSSYTGQPIPAVEMREWVDATVARLAALHAQDVLEIGCGTGLLLSRLAPHCRRYVGTDISAVAIERIGRLQAAIPALGHVTALHRPADDFSGIEAASLDLVILNSVAQYLPNLDYFLRVFAGAVRALRPGGHLFLGDLRSLPLLAAYHTSVQLFQAPDTLNAAALRQRIALRMAQEDELVLDPTLFFALRQHHPAIGAVRVLVKRGQHLNEMTRFRYDVAVSIGPETPGPAVHWIDGRPSIDEIGRMLQDRGAVPLAISAIPNARLQQELRTQSWLEAADAGATIGDLRRGPADSEAFDPEALFALGEKLGFQVELSWASASPEGRFDAVFYRGTRPDLSRSGAPGPFRALPAYATNPLRRKLALELIPDLRQDLRKQLPAYMVPAAYVLIDEFPLTTNGKLDRAALPAPDTTGRAATEDFVAPRTETERILAEIWAEVLGLEQIGVTQNFFELGGDSILSIQIVSRALQAGLSLSPRQVFQHQSIEELAAVAGTAAQQEEPDPVAGEAVPLTPIQHWFFEMAQPEPHHFNQAILLETVPQLDTEVLCRAVLELPAHHPGLRLRFSRDADGWHQVYAETDGSATFLSVDWPTEARDATLQRVAARLQSSLDLSAGPMLRAAHFTDPAGGPGRLLLVIHHLVVDGVSWRILLEDLETACRALAAGAPVILPPRTSSFRRWAEHLNDHARSGRLAAEVKFWRDQTGVAPLPGGDAGENLAATSAVRSFQLPPDSTAALLHDVPPVYRTGINDILLTALVQSFADWTGRPDLLVDLEGHGREDLFPDLDIARAIGWFTSIFPVRLSLAAGEVRGEAIKAIKEQLRQIPKNGIGYGMLRYLTDDPALRDGQQPEIAFNYLGQLDMAVGTSRYFRPAAEATGPSLSPLHKRRHQIEINASIFSGQLRVEWVFAPRRLAPETVERLGQAYLDRLQALIDHCRDPDAGGFTPSDFAGARVGRAKLDRLLTKLKRHG